jgi:hypothetical protein
MRGASGGTCLDDLSLVVVSTIVGWLVTGPGAACLLVVVVVAEDGFPPAASCSGISVDAELQIDKSTVDNAYYYLLLLLMLTEVCRYLHVHLAVCGRECVPTRSSSAPLLARRALATLTWWLHRRCSCSGCLRHSQQWCRCWFRWPLLAYLLYAFPSTRGEQIGGRVFFFVFI